MIDIFSGFALFLLGLAFAMVGGWGLKTFSGMLTNSKFRNTNGASGGILPNVLFGCAFTLGIVNMIQGIQVMAGS